MFAFAFDAVDDIIEATPGALPPRPPAGVRGRHPDPPAHRGQAAAGRGWAAAGRPSLFRPPGKNQSDRNTVVQTSIFKGSTRPL